MLLKVLNLMREEIIPLVGGGAHYTIYTKALHAYLKKEKMIVFHDILNMYVKGEHIGEIPLGTVIKYNSHKKDVVIISSNNGLVEKDSQMAKRILRFSYNDIDRVILINVDWFGVCTYLQFKSEDIEVK